MLFFFRLISTSSPSFRSISPRGFRTLFSYRALITQLMTSPISFCFPRINGYGLTPCKLWCLQKMSPETMQIMESCVGWRAPASSRACGPGGRRMAGRVGAGGAGVGSPEAQLARKGALGSMWQQSSASHPKHLNLRKTEDCFRNLESIISGDHL